MTAVVERVARTAQGKGGHWSSDALCAKMRNAASAAPADLKELCGFCPVVKQCLATAMADKSLIGIWGGTTERERRLMRAGAGKAADPGPAIASSMTAVRAERNRLIVKLDRRGATASQIALALDITARTVRRVLVQHRNKHQAEEVES